ncbi:polysaccharide deacetylase family protein [Nocardia aurantia]|uniref:NodB homology domain-containing protein n=1 Tax=Nocardia aurantia TaxID=2585199 RepID=A0A7K0DGH1_9NOCA|nr:polysaccharide deacetylase family protein [Nocardia aurantia]MQY24747.1 hypothetical protein [Nocardia aurantia]
MSVPELSRRRLLVSSAVAAAGFVAAACGHPQNNSPVANSAAPQPASAVPTSDAVAARVPVARPGVSPQAVAARYTGRRPTRWGMDLDGITTTIPVTGKQMALTFDACGGPGNNEINDDLIDFLIAHEIPATLFLNKRWIDADPGRASRLAADPLFELANHGTRHCPLSVNGHAAYDIDGTMSPQQAVDEVWGNHERLTQLTGQPPRFFRAGTAHYDEVAVAIVHDLGETPVGFSVNADAGATYTAAQVRKAMSEVTPGAISIGHMHRPQSGTAPGMSAALPALRAAGYEFVKLP